MDNNFLEQFEVSLLSYLDTPKLKSSHLYSPTLYALSSPAKRLRPQMVSAISAAHPALFEVAAAIEMIHTYSLIHDDLPCMDDDDIRRKKPSLHIAFDEPTALLTGNFLLTHAFQIISSSPKITHFAKSKIINVLSSFGGFTLLNGQLLDINAKDLTLDKLLSIYHQKTSSLFIAALLSGAYLANLKQDQIDLLISFGSSFGILFQLYDDISDFNPLRPQELNILNLLDKNSTLHYIHQLSKELKELLPHIQINTKQLSHILSRQQSTAPQ